MPRADAGDVPVTWQASVLSVRFNDAMRCQAIGKRVFQAYVSSVRFKRRDPIPGHGERVF
jgi:hypothetical protein